MGDPVVIAGDPETVDETLMSIETRSGCAPTDAAEVRRRFGFIGFDVPFAGVDDLRRRP